MTGQQQSDNRTGEGGRLRSSRAARGLRTADLYQAADAARRDGDDAGVQRCHEELILLNLPVAEAIATRYRGRGVEDDDLRQLAYLGLTRAVDHFDSQLGDNFLSYAVPTIRGEIQRYFRDHGWAVRPPRRLQELQWRLHRAVSELTQSQGRMPTPEELCAVLDVSRDEYEQARAAYGSFAPTSLDAPLASMASSGSTAPAGDLDLGRQVADEAAVHHAAAADARLTLIPVLRDLSERERRIVYLRFVQDRTQREIGEELGVTQMSISRSLTRILARLRGLLEETPQAS